MVFDETNVCHRIVVRIAGLEEDLRIDERSRLRVGLPNFLNRSNLQQSTIVLVIPTEGRYH